MPEQKITLAYRLDFEQPVWQIRFDAEAGWLALECREPEVLQVSYSVVEVATGNLLISNYNPANSWWTGLADIKAGLLYLHQRGTKGLGQPAGLIALAVPSGEIKWQLPGYSFYGLTRNYILARPGAEDTAVVGLNFETGVAEGETGTLKELAASQESFQAQRSSAFQVPLHYPAENIYFAELSQFVLLKTGIRAQWAIDYLENQDLLLIGFYSENARGGKSYRVAIFNRAGGALLGQEELGKDLTGLGTDNFFVFQENLFLLKDKKSLLAFRF